MTGAPPSVAAGVKDRSRLPLTLILRDLIISIVARANRRPRHGAPGLSILTRHSAPTPTQRLAAARGLLQSSPGPAGDAREQSHISYRSGITARAPSLP